MVNSQKSAPQRLLYCFRSKKVGLAIRARISCFFRPRELSLESTSVVASGMRFPETRDFGGLGSVDSGAAGARLDSTRHDKHDKIQALAAVLLSFTLLPTTALLLLTPSAPEGSFLILFTCPRLLSKKPFGCCTVLDPPDLQLSLLVAPYYHGPRQRDRFAHWHCQREYTTSSLFISEQCAILTKNPLSDSSQTSGMYDIRSWGE